MNSIIRLKQGLTPFMSGFVVFLIIVTASCSSSSSKLSVLAETNQTNTENKISGQEDLEVLQGIENPCDFRSEKGLFEQPGSKKLYELKNAGYPKEISLNEAVAVFNKFAQCDEPGKAQSPLRAEEVIAALRDYDCKKNSPNDKKICTEFRKIAETGTMPKGALLDYSNGIGGYSVNRGYDGYDVKTWEIYLYIRLDKYRNDLKDIPQFSHLIRLRYISSEPKKDNQ